MAKVFSQNERINETCGQNFAQIGFVNSELLLF